MLKKYLFKTVYASRDLNKTSFLKYNNNLKSN